MYFLSHEAADEKIIRVSLDRSYEDRIRTLLRKELTRHMVFFADVDFSLSS